MSANDWRGQLRHPDPQRRRDAIIFAGKSRDREAIKALQQLLTWETDPALRQLCEKAVQHLTRTTAPAGARQAALIDPLGLDEAERYFVRALKAYQADGAAASAPMLAKALNQDPTLRDDPLVRRIASQATGLSDAVAVDVLVDASRYGQILRRDRGGWRLTSQNRVRHWLMLLLVSAGMLFLMLRTGVFDNYLSSLQNQAIREHLVREGDAEYFLIVPETPPPPEGWGVIVALHDDYHDAQTLLPLFMAHPDAEKMILVIPTFGEYPTPFSDKTTPTIHQILTHIRAEYPVHDAGAVVFGYRFGGEIATLYASEYYLVAGVVAVGARNLVMPPPDDPTTTYVMVYGEFDTETRRRVQGQLDTLQVGANPVEIYVSYGIGAELHPDHIQIAFDLAGRLFR